MKKALNICLSIALTLSSYGQEYDRTAESYSESITAGELEKHLKIIASDKFEGRETGKEGQKKAMRYLIDQFKSYGIKDYESRSYVQPFSLIEQENKGVSLKIKNKEFQLNKDYTLSPSIINKTEITGDILFVGYGISEDNYNNYKNIVAYNRAVFIMDGLPEGVELKEKWTMQDKINYAKENGATAIFYHSPTLKENLIKYEHYFNKKKLKLQDDVKESDPVIIAATTELTETFLKKGRLNFKKIEKKGIKEDHQFSVPLELMIDKPTEGLTGENVLAYIPGTDKKEELVVITAHYDHIGKEGDKIFNGADDDGTGTVALLEISQAFQQAVKEGFAPRRSILIMPVSGEEKGLLGSKYYTNHPIFPMENTVANLNIDMIGRYDEKHENDSNYIYLIGSDKLSSDLHNLSEKVNNIYTNIGLDYTFNDDDDPNRFYYRSDHYNFAKNNIPVIFYFSGVHADYHKETDTVEKIDFEKTERVAKLVFFTAWHLANQDERIKLDEIETKEEN